MAADLIAQRAVRRAGPKCSMDTSKSDNAKANMEKLAREFVHVLFMLVRIKKRAVIVVANDAVEIATVVA